MRLLTVSYSERERSACELCLLGLHTISKQTSQLSGDTEITITVLVPERLVVAVLEMLRRIK
jgi:hypothetical protein